MAFSMLRRGPGVIVRCPSATNVWCRPVGHFHVVWLPTVRAGDHPARRSTWTRTRVAISLTTTLVYSLDDY